MDIADIQGNRIISGLPLITGCNLLAQLKHLGINADIYIISDSDPAANPTYDTLGVSCHLCVVESGIISEIPLIPASQILQCTMGGKYALTITWRPQAA